MIQNPNNFIKFWFEFSNKIKSEKPKYVYLHCFLDTCSDYHKSGSKADSFFSNFKSCEKLSHKCHSGETKSTSATSTLAPITTTFANQNKPNKNGISTSLDGLERPIDQSFNNNRNPFLMQRPKSRYRGGSSGNDYTDDNDFSRFQPQRVEEERIFLLKSITSNSGRCNAKLSYGPIFLEDKPFLDDDNTADESDNNKKPTQDFFSENFASTYRNHFENLILGNSFFQIVFIKNNNLNKNILRVINNCRFEYLHFIIIIFQITFNLCNNKFLIFSSINKVCC